MDGQKPDLPADGTKKPGRREYYLFAFRIMSDFGISIAVPAVVAALLGQYLDGKYGRYPLFIILCLITAFLITIRIIQKKSKSYGEEYARMNQASKNKS
jgi:F0F1-type ATP synthase assembly protein I